MAEDKKVAPVFRPEEKGLRKVFGELEAEIMAYLWGRGQGTVSEVFKALTARREVAYNTVRTVMERLAEKGYLRCDSHQRAYIYTPTQSQEAFWRQVGQTVLGGLLQDVGETFATHLLEETVRQCNPDDLDRLQALIESCRSGTPTSGAHDHEP
jgi:predicted transcriptional regulator